MANVKTGVDVFTDSSGGGGGGGGLTNWTEAVSIAAPNATIPVVSWTPLNAAANVDALLTPKGTGAILAQLPDNLATGGDKRGTNAVDFQFSRSSSSMVASGTRSFIGGGERSTVAQTNGAVLGGEANSVTGAGVQNGAIVGGLSNSVTSGYGFVGGGQSNQTFGGANTYAGVVGGTNNITSATRAFIGGGQSNSILNGTCLRNAIIGGNGNLISLAEAQNSVILGGEYAYTYYRGEVANANGRFSATGDAQSSYLVVRRSVTVAAPAVTMTMDDGAPTLINTLVLVNNQAHQFTIRVIAKEATVGSTQCAWWNINGGIIRGTGVGTTTLVGANVVDTGNAGGNSAGWTCVAQANVIDGALQILVSAPAGTGTIRFVASVNFTRVSGT